MKVRPAKIGILHHILIDRVENVSRIVLSVQRVVYNWGSSELEGYIYLTMHWRYLDRIKHIVRELGFEKYLCILCKILMLKVAEKISKSDGYNVIVTGEAIGQVASQTLRNISIISSFIKTPILRPLACLNKQEIINTLERLQPEYHKLISKYTCPFTPRKPSAKGSLRIAKELYGKVNLEQIAEEEYRGLVKVRIL